MLSMEINLYIHRLLHLLSITDWARKKKDYEIAEPSKLTLTKELRMEIACCVDYFP